MAEHLTTDESERPRSKGKPPYFLQPAKGGGITVFRRACGNRAIPKECGTMPSKPLAINLVRQLQRAESVLNDLFLEATDDGIEALEAVLEACRTAVLGQTQVSNAGTRRRRRGKRPPPRAA